MSKEDIVMSLGLMQSMMGREYSGQNITLDSEVNDCLFYMYIFMMSSDEKFLDEFRIRYRRLNDEQREFVENDYNNIINTQDDKEKIKRKGEMNYE